jgi:SAM-dependent methyltransferase
VSAGKFTYLSYRRHRICNPLSFETLERTLSYADLRAGDLVFDLGCGNAVVSAWLAQRRGLRVKAVERFEPVAALARETAAAVEGPGEVEVVVSTAAPFLAQAGKCRLILAIGTVNLLPDAREPEDVFAALAGSTEPGGYLLWGDPFWKTAPGPRLSQVFVNERYQTHAGYVGAGEKAGLTPIYAGVSTEADWDDYSWRMNTAVEDWIAENPTDPDAPAFKARVGMMRTLYLEDVREQMGFGLYLFRKPA